MDSLLIQGGVSLKGTVKVSGAKNAALPILFGGILFDKPIYFENVPHLRDIQTTQKLLETLGFETHFENNKMELCPKQTINPEAPYDLVKTMRASVLCLGPLLARLGEASVAMPGGCAIGARPVDLHLSALEKMGAEFTLDGGYIKGRCKKLKGAHIQFDFPTVGGTENIMMAAALAEGETVLENAAREPEIVDLANFLNSCGAKIEGAGNSQIKIQGVASLTQNSPYRIMPDRIEAGTYLIAAAMTNGEVRVENCPYKDMEALCDKLQACNVKLSFEENAVIAQKHGELNAVDIRTLPHPGFPTDMQAQFMAMLCLCKGSGVVEETIFENRFMHVPELIRMGADIRLSGNSAVVRGVPTLTGAPVMASDLRAGAALVIAGLCADGETRVDRIYHVDRGYEGMELKLQGLGARIRRVSTPA